MLVTVVMLGTVVVLVRVDATVVAVAFANGEMETCEDCRQRDADEATTN